MAIDVGADDEEDDARAETAEPCDGAKAMHATVSGAGDDAGPPEADVATEVALVNDATGADELDAVALTALARCSRQKLSALVRKSL